MRRLALATVLTTALVSPLSGQNPEFEVASIKRNTSDRPTATPPPVPGQIALTWIPARFIVTRGYPDLTTPIEVVGLPSWANDPYDVVVKFRPDATLAEQQQMWRTLLADRMKLAAHYETRQRSAYNLVVARSDGRLGPNLKPSTLDCPPPVPGVRPEPPPPELMEAMRPGAVISAATEQALLSRCRSTFTAGNTSYAGAVPIDGLIMAVGMGSRLERTVINKTGLEGLYSLKLTFHRSPNPPGPDDPPSIFTALQEQLGLKLEPTTIDGNVLVVDHIERPTEN